MAAWEVVGRVCPRTRKPWISARRMVSSQPDRKSCAFFMAGTK